MTSGRGRPRIQELIARQNTAVFVIAVRIVEGFPVRSIILAGEIDVAALNPLNRILSAPVPLGQDEVQPVGILGGDILLPGLNATKAAFPVRL